MDKTNLILGLPVQTDIGYIYPVKVKDYGEFLKYRTLLLKQDFQYKEELTESIKDESFEGVLSSAHFFELMRQIRAIYPSNDNFFSELYESYREMFKYHFREDVVERIKTPEEFEEYRDLIMEVNAIDFEKPNPNKEIQLAIDLHKKLQANKGDGTSFESVVTSVALMFSVDINELTLYQLYSYFERAIKFTTFETTRLYSIFSEEIKLEPWYTDIKKVKKEEVTLSEEDIQEVKIEGLRPLQFEPDTNKSKE